VSRTASVLFLFLSSAVGCAASSNDAGVSPMAAPPPGASAPRGEGVEVGRASYYSDRLRGRRTASGEPYDPEDLTAAHRTLPFGTLVDVARPDARHVVVRINDRGPHVRGRVIDLSRRAAAALGIVQVGTADVALRVISLP
jgi:rare lipoprotein A